MQIRVSSKNLHHVLAKFRPRKNAKIEFNINPGRLDIVANREGWLTFARWCLVMAHPEMHEATGPDDPDFLASHRHLGDGLVDGDMQDEGRVIEAFWALPDDEVGQDVRFWRAKEIGRDFWPPERKTGNSPMSELNVWLSINRYDWLSGMSRAAVEEKLGAPVGQNECGDILYRADVPGGVLEVVYSAAETVDSFGL